MSFTNVASQEATIAQNVGDDLSISVAFDIPDLAPNSIGVVMLLSHAVGGAIAVGSCTWGGSAATKTIPAGTSVPAQSAHMWHLVNPPDNASRTIVITFTNVTEVSLSAHLVIAYADAGAAVTLDDTSEETGTTISPNIISTQAGADELVISASASSANAVSATPVTDCTQLQNYDSGGNCSIAAYSIPVASGDATHQHNYSQSNPYAMISASFKEDAGGGTEYPQSVAGAITPAGVVAKQTGKAFGGGITPSGAIAKLTAKIFGGSITPAGVLTAIKTALVSLSGGITPAGALSKQVNKQTEGGITPAGALANRIGKLLSGGATPTGTVSKQTAKAMGGGITPSGVLAAIKTALISLAGGITPSGALSRQTNKQIAGSITPSGSIAKAVSKALAGALIPAGTISKAISKTLSGALTSTGGIVKQIGKALSGVLASAGELLATLSESTPVTDWISLTLPDRDYSLTVHNRSVAATLLSRSDDLTLLERNDDLTVDNRSANLTLTVEERA